MTDYALSHFIHLCRFIPTLQLHLPYTAHGPRSETGVSNSIHIAKCLSISFIDWVPALLSLN